MAAHGGLLPPEKAINETTVEFNHPKNSLIGGIIFNFTSRITYTEEIKTFFLCS